MLRIPTGVRPWLGLLGLLTVGLHLAATNAEAMQELEPGAFAASPLADAEPKSLREATLDFQRAKIRDAVAAHGGNWAAAARSLGMQRSNLHHLAKRLGL